MKKQLKDDKFKRLLEEQYIKEAEILEKKLLSDRDTEEPFMSEEKVKSSYDQLIQRMKADGVYREEDKIVSLKEVRDTKQNTKKYAIYRKRVEAAGFWIACILGICLAVMSNQIDSAHFFTALRCFAGENAELSGRDEYGVISEIEEKLDLKMPQFLYRPQEMKLCGYRVDLESQQAEISYQYNGFSVSAVAGRENFEENTDILCNDDRKIADVPVRFEDKEIAVFKGDEASEYCAQWEYENVFYYVSGSCEQDFFISLIENISF